jgi:pimeloyl-ACP methyl ester carboxylesterase
MSLENPYDVPVHIWQGSEDYIVPSNLQQHLASNLPWVKYHELEGYGHLLDYYPGLPEKLMRILLEDANQKDFTL